MSDESKRETEYRVMLRGPSVVVGPHDLVVTLDKQSLPQGLGLAIWTIHEPTEIGIVETAPTDLVFDLRVPATSVAEAISRAEGISSVVSGFLSFAHNAHIGTPVAWIAYPCSVESTKDWRQMFTNAFAAQKASIRKRWRALNPKFVTRFLPLVLYKLHDKPSLYRALQFYVYALDHWRIKDDLPAAQYLALAVENLSESVRAAYEATPQGADRKAQMQSENRVAYEQRIPKRWSQSERDQFRALFEQTTIGKELNGPAAARCMVAAMSQTIFAGAADVYTQLREFSNGFEHAKVGVEKLRAMAVEILDRTAPLVRAWLVKEIVDDPTLRDELLSEPFRQPQMRDEFHFIGLATFRSELQHPGRGECSPYLKITPRFDRTPAAIKGLILDVDPQFADGTEIRERTGKINEPVTTFADFEKNYPFRRFPKVADKT